MTCLQHAGLPHSEICGSVRICRYPQLIAAYHVLLRLWEPRHPPCALSYFLHAHGPFAAMALRREQPVSCPAVLSVLSSISSNMSKNVCQSPHPRTPQSNGYVALSPI